MRWSLLGLVAAIVIGIYLLTRGDGGDAPDLARLGAEQTGLPAEQPAGPPAVLPGEPISREPAADAEVSGTDGAETGAESASAQHEILVLDQDRKPVAGISYAGTHDLESRHGFSRPDSRTDIAGRGRLSGIEPGNLRSYFVRVGFHGPKAVGARLPPGAADARPVEIVLPPFGFLRVEAAQELSQYAQVLLFQQQSAERRGLMIPVATLPLQDGSARIPFVGLGLTWVVSLRAETGGGSLSRTVQGPVTAGEEVVVRFESGADPILTGILADETGVPLGCVELHYVLRGESGSFGSNLKTDAAGRFTVPLTEEHLKAAPSSLDFRRYLPAGGRGFGSHEEDPGSLARVDLPQPLPRNAVDLGELRFVSTPVLLSGIVRDQSGDPVADATLVVDELQSVLPSGEEYWNHQNDLLRARSAADGRFTIYGEKPERAIRLRAYASAFLPEPPMLIAYGETGLEMVLDQGGSLAGIVQWVGGGELSELNFTLESAASVVQPSGGSIDGDTYHMKVKAAPEGVYALVGRIEGTEEEFLRLEGIVIRTDEESTDPRLQPLDLSPYLGVVSVAPRAPDGTLPDRCMVLRLRENGGGGTNIRSPDGVHRLPVLPGGTADLLVESSGFRSVHLPKASGALSAKLEPIFDVTLHVRGDAPLTNEQGAYSIQAVPAAGAGWPRLLLNRAQSQMALQADRKASFPALVLGAWELSLIVPRLNPRGNAYHEAVSLGRIEIGTGDAGRVFEVDLPELPD